jgi:hypothetical protein
LAKTTQAIQKVDSLRDAIQNLPPGAFLEDVLSPNSRAFLEAQQQQLGTPTSVGGVIQQLLGRAGGSPQKEVSPSAFMNLMQAGGEEPQASEPRQASPFQMNILGQGVGGQRRLSLDPFFTGAPEGPSSAEIAAKFILAQQERMDQRKQLREQQMRQREVRT